MVIADAPSHTSAFRAAGQLLESGDASTPAAQLSVAAAAASAADNPPQQEQLQRDLLLGLWQQEPTRQVLDRLRTQHGGPLGPEAQRQLADALTNTPLLRVLRPRALYLGRLLKQLVEAVEAESGGQIADELAELHVETLLEPTVGARMALGVVADWGCDWLAIVGPATPIC